MLIKPSKNTVFLLKSIVIASILTHISLYAANGMVVQTDTLWKSPTIASEELFANIQHTPLWQYKNSTYFVWADTNARPKLTKITNGKVEEEFLDPNPDYTAEVDGHNRFAMGIDQDGYIHITGDMHNYTDGSVSAGSKNYPARYQKQAILYWKSNKPEDIKSGFSFVGEKNATTAIPGTGWSYGRFFKDNNGVLFYNSRVKAISAGHVPGEMGLGLYRYDVSTKKWTALGGLANDTRQGSYNKVVVWENAGMAPDKWYQGFMSSFHFDKDNNLHLATAINTDITLAGNNRLIYAMSKDGGSTWYKANGTKIPALPIRAVDTAANVGDVIASTNKAPFFDSRTKVIADKNGKPGVSLDGNWFIWNGKQWDKTASYTPTNTADLNNKNQLVLTSTNSSKVALLDAWNEPAYSYDLGPYKSYQAVSELGIQQTGEVYGIGINSDKTQSILKTVFNMAPLPASWSTKDISTTPLAFASTDGYLDNRFTMTSYATSLDGVNDSFNYIYQPFTGDGVIDARVVSTTAPNPQERAGVMMRETLNPDSKSISNTINTKRTGAIVSYRATTGATTTTVWTNNIAAPYWVRLERKNNEFISSISKDGKSWSQTAKATIAMPKTIYLGLAAAGYNPSTMQTAVFDNVSATIDSCVHAKPVVSLSPAAQTSPAGESRDFTLTVINSDPKDCAVSIFNLSAVLPQGLQSSFDKTNLSLAAGQTGSTIVHVNSSATTTPNTYSLSVNATNADQVDSQTTALAKLTVTEPCVINDPTITIAPGSQTTSELNPAKYQITLVNNDSKTCAMRLFRFTALPSTYFIKTFMEPNNVRVNPGQAVQSQLVLTPTEGLPAGKHTAKVITQVGGMGATELIYEIDQPTIELTADKEYVRKASPYEANILVKTSINGTEASGLPLTAVLTFPDKHTEILNTTTWSQGRLLMQTIDANTALGIYKVDITVTYKDKLYKKQIEFTVK
jgi:regulation of enolase protein 1 (concanavalin A-like superfamily)